MYKHVCSSTMSAYCLQRRRPSPIQWQGNKNMLQCTSYAKDIARDVGTGSMQGSEGTCASGAGEHGDCAGRSMCRGCEWGLAFYMRFAMPGYIIVLPDSTSFRYRSRRMSKSHLKIELYLCAVSRGAGVPAMQRYAHHLIDAEASRPRKDRCKNAVGA